MIKQKLGFFVISVKYLSNAMGRDLEENEKAKILAADEIPVSGFGFASILGFENEADDTLHISGSDIYSEDGVRSGNALRQYLETI